MAFPQPDSPGLFYLPQIPFANQSLLPLVEHLPFAQARCRVCFPRLSAFFGYVSARRCLFNPETTAEVPNGSSIAEHRLIVKVYAGTALKTATENHSELDSKIKFFAK